MRRYVDKVLLAGVLVCSGITCQAHGAAVIYVDDDASPGGDGRSWATAYRYLQDALGDAGAGGEVRVAQGVYTPDRGGGNTAGDQHVSFELKSGVAFRGGYAGIGAVNPDARDTGAYETVLSGDLDGDDGPHISADFDNSQVVVRGVGVDETAVLDGFTITGGHGWSGPGISLYHSSPLILNCSIIGNKSAGREGGFGGGLYCGDSSPVLKNCLIAGNYAAMMGGGVWSQGHSELVLVNCTVAYNVSPAGSGIRSNQNCSCRLENCIVWGNETGKQLEGSFEVEYSDVEAGYAGIGNIDADPFFANPQEGDYHLLSEAGRWDEAEGRWRRNEVTSACIDAGDPMSTIGYEPFPHGGRVNMGAYGGTGRASKSYFGGAGCETIVAGDINGDCKVNGLDLALLSQHWLGE